MPSTAHRLYALLLRHGAACVLALFIGVVSVAPQWYAAYNTPSYAGIALMGTDAEQHYVARVQEVYAGYPSLGNVFLPNKGIPPLEPALGEDIVAYLGMILHISAVQMDVLGKFVFPFLIALLLYGLLYVLSRRRIAALLGVLFAMWGDSLMDGPRALLGLVRGVAPVSDFLTYARPINPEISALFLFGSLLAVYWFFFRELHPSRRLVRTLALAALGLMAGLSLYVSIYVYTFLLAFGLLLFAYALLKKEYGTAGELGLVGGVALLSAGPFIVNYIHARALPAYADASLRFGLIANHAPIMSLWVLLLALGALFLPRREKSARVFFLIAALALAVVLNQQIITGHVMQSGHYHWYITKPLAGLMLGWYAVLLAEFALGRSWMRYAAYGFLSGMLLYTAVLVQTASYRAAAPALSAAQAYAPILSYLHAQPAPAVVWADRTLSLFIPLYTHNDAPNNGYAEYYLVPNAYLVERLLLEYRLRGVTPQQILGVMRRDRADISQRIFGVYWRDAAGSYDALPNALIESYARRYAALYQEPLATVFRQLGVTEIVWDAAAAPSWNLGAQSGLHIVATIGRYSVYRL